MSVKGYKVFNPDWTCRGFKYEVGKTYKHNGNISICNAGFHFCLNVADCFNYYSFDSRNKVAEVEAIGNVLHNGDKSVTDEIVILRELNWHEVLELVNTGLGCSGYRNSGNWNSGNWNSGDYNSGYRNSGYRNSGYRNSGGWNSTNFSTGFFNSVKQPLYAFNKPLNVDRDTFNNNLAVNAMNTKYRNNWWISSEDMSDEEKENHPEYETTRGYLKIVDFKIACGIMWNNMTEEEKDAVWTIPNFDPEVFKEITGIEVRPDESRKEQEV